MVGADRLRPGTGPRHHIFPLVTAAVRGASVGVTVRLHLRV